MNQLLNNISPNMKLSPEQVKKVIQHLSKNAPNGIKCPVCGETHWLINDTIFQTIEYTGSTIKIGGGTALVPLVMIACGTCHHTMLFNAMRLGLLNSAGEIINKQELQQ